MECIVLAGGTGTRLRQAVPDLPKPMAPIAGRPFLEYLLDKLAAGGVTRVVLSVGYMAEKITTHFGQSFHGMAVDYVVEDLPLGTGGAIRFAMEQVRSDHAFIFNGDTFLDLEIGEVEAVWQSQRRPVLVGRVVPDTTRYGRILEKDGIVAGFTEKGQDGPGLISAGCYIFGRHQLDMFELMTPFSIETDYLAREYERQAFSLFVTSGHFIDIGIPEDFHRAQTELREFGQKYAVPH
jgi:D-glycero-alpha-D-manno-heptose 1-phosphate guanylyltransferase